MKIQNVKSSEGLFEYNYDIVCKTFYLSDNLVDDDYAKWFESKCINVLNKTCCGNGGTTGFINYARKHFKGILILCPNVSICKSKEVEYEGCDDVCCVYGGSEPFRKDATVVISTYDQFHKMMKELDDYGVDFNEDWSSRLWSGRTILIDEYHKITDECSFRNICYDVTKLIKRHDNGVLLMSATPHWEYVEFLKEYMPEREVKVYTVKYEEMEDVLIDQGVPRLIQLYDVRKKFADIISKTYRSTKNKQIVIFYNNRDDVKKIIQKMEIKDVEVLCSGEHKEDFGEYYSPIFNESKKLHFMTSAYFTGCDINVHVDVCIIIGSRSHSFLSYSARDIKQMIGRFRKGCSGVHLFYNGKALDQYDYNENKTEFDKCCNYLNSVEGDWMDDDEAVKCKQKSLMLQDRLDNAEHWKDIKAVKKMLEEYGYIVKEQKIGEFETIVKPKKLSLKETKKRIIKGLAVNWMENPIVVQCKAYYKEKGADAFWRASQSDIKNWYKVYKNDKDNVGGDDEKISTMLPHELFDSIIKDEGYYSGAFLKAALKYVGVKCEYSEISVNFYETFDAYACCLSNDSIGSRSKWLVLKKTTKCHDLTESHINNEYTSKHDILYSTTLISYNNKMDTQNHCLAKTFKLYTIPFHSLTGIPLYDWVVEDKPGRLPLIKGDKKWSSIKNFSQSKISEMFKYTTNQYRHSIKEMEYINCLICDIDSGIIFSKFKEIYKNYKWIAYPTLNNNTKDWLKFRVIVPLDQPIELKGENNLKVLKVLRTMFCYYEDPNHQMASYINQEDWEQRYENNGELWHIDQDLVDDLMLRIKNFRDYKNTAFVKKENITSSTHLSSISLEGAKEYFEGSFQLADGARHKALFIIKNRLSDTDRALFEDWLISIYPTYIGKWKSHKII